MINVAVLGYGTVGSGVVEVIEGGREQVCKGAGEEVRVKYILDLRDFPGDPYEDRVIHDFNLILEDEEIRIVCEAMGGIGAAYRFTRQALEAGKSVCTSNKELVAEHGAELMALAAEKGCNYMFEASVGGGIPIIRAMSTSLAAEKIESVMGILNGTTNYILTRMGESPEADYSTVLRQAQELGYAEADPRADVEGHDACRKIAILSSMMAGRNVEAGRIQTEGISEISPADFFYGGIENRTIKLLALSQIQEDGSILAMVAPFLIPKDHPLSRVNDVFNAVYVRGSMLGEVMFYGKGAGKYPTASAVVADAAACVRNLNRPLGCAWTQEPARLTEPGHVERQFYLRLDNGTQKEAAELFAGGKFLVAVKEMQLRELSGPLYGFRELTAEEFASWDPGSAGKAAEKSALAQGKSSRWDPCEAGEFACITPVMKESEFQAKCALLGDGVRSRIRLL